VFERDEDRAAGISRDGDLARLLAAASNDLQCLWPDRPMPAQQLGALAARLAEERLRVAVLGQFKRGKSTFLNALLGQAVLPTGVLPLTAVPAFLRNGADYQVEVHYLDGRTPERITAAEPETVRAALRRMVTEAGNPHNAAGIARVDVRLPAPFLAQGIELVDTPGIGSTLQRNTDAAFAVLPECDAAFFVVSVDPPITAAELDYLGRLGSAGIAPIIFVLNKIDYLGAAERAEAAAFLRKTISGRVVATDASPIFEVSARDALAARERKDDPGLERSGIPAIERYMAKVLARNKQEILRDAIVRKADAILAAAATDAALARKTLELPLDDLADRGRRFGEALQIIEQQRLRAADLLAGDRRRLRAAIEAQAETLREESRASLLPLIDRAFTEAASQSAAEANARQAIAAAIPGLFEAALEQASGELRHRMAALLGEHIARAEDVVGAVRRTAAQLFEIPIVENIGAEAFVAARQPYWVTQKWEETLNPFSAGLLDALAPPALRRARLKRRLAVEVTGLVARNAENLRWATLQNVEAAFQRFAAWFDGALGDAIAATGGAIDAARRQRLEHADQAAANLARYQHAATWIAARRQELKAMRQAVIGAQPNTLPNTPPDAAGDS
jgi:hypothetical protein